MGRYTSLTYFRRFDYFKREGSVSMATWQSARQLLEVNLLLQSRAKLQQTTLLFFFNFCLAEDSHEMSCLISMKKSIKDSSAAVVIGNVLRSTLLHVVMVGVGWLIGWLVKV